MNSILLIPIMFPIIGAPIVYIIGRSSKSARDFCASLLTCVVFLCSLLILILAQSHDIQLFIPEICGLGISFKADGFRGIFSIITCYMWMMTTIYSSDYLKHSHNRNRYYFFLLISLGAVCGLFYSNDLFTTFIFFEIMSLSSYVCIVHDEKDDTMRAGGVYLVMAILGSLVTLMGLFILYNSAGTLQFNELKLFCYTVFHSNDLTMKKNLYISGGCILFGFATKAGMFPLHVWLPLAHSVAPAPASALLSGIITKTGMFGILILTSYIFMNVPAWGFVILLFGVVTMLLGGILAVFSVDIKRTLACSSMSQLGMILTGIGMICLLGNENSIAVRGSILHMVNHSNLKLVLFMSAGVIVMNLHKLNMNDVRGYGRNKPLLHICFLIGALGIAGVPLFNGYISKTLLHEAFIEAISLLKNSSGLLIPFIKNTDARILFRIFEWLFLITGGLTFAYMLKLYVCIFIERNTDEEAQKKFDSQKKYCSLTTAAVLLISSLVLLLFGLFPHRTLDIIAYTSESFLTSSVPEHTIHYLSWSNLKGGLISLLIGAVIYLFIVRRSLISRSASSSGKMTYYENKWPAKLDLVNSVYEPVFMVFLPKVFGFLSRILDTFLDGWILVFSKTTHRHLKEASIPPLGYYLSFYVGTFLNFIVSILNKTIYSGNKIQKDFILVLAERQEIVKNSRKLITSSAAFSLIMFGAGMVITVLYLLT